MAQNSAAVSAQDRLIPTETNPSSLVSLVDKSLPTTPSEPPTPKTKLNGSPPKPHNKSGADEKEELMERMQSSKDDRLADMGKEKGDHWEKDPTTGLDVLIRHAQFKDFRDKGLDNAALDPENPKAGTADRRPPDAKTQDPRYPAPAPAEPGNICLQSFPPPIDPVDITKVKNIIRTGALVTSALCFVVWFFAATGKRVTWLQFFWRSFLISSVAGIAWTTAENAGRKIEKELERVRINMHTQRAEAYSPPTPESVEWLNAILKVVWGLVNPDMFVPIVDMVEDVLQASLPSFVDAVRVADIGQGTNPVRVVSMRALPDQAGHPGYPREEWVGLDKDAQSKAQAQDIENSESQVDTDQTGDYLNYEVALSYQALPGQQGKLRFHNIHLMLEFFIGAWDWFKIPVPFYVTVEGFVATARMRIQLVQNPPFIRNVTVTLMGVPKVEVSVEPFTKKLPNVLDMPMIKNFVEMGMASACAQYVAPKSLTINLAEMLVGDGIKKDTKALGVFVVTIHHAEGLSAQDSNGQSDPYMVLAYAKFGKPLHSTRIIKGDLNPVWEETAFLLVTEDEVKGQEDLSAMLWDSDKRTADDLVGRVNIPVNELMKTPNKLIPRIDKLRGFEDANEMPGTLHWDVGYFEKAEFNKLLQVQNDSNASVLNGGPPTKAKPSAAATPAENDVTNTPPDPEISSGILSVIVHQINSLERQDIQGTTGSREGQTGQDTSEPAQEGENLPNSYCEIIINDDMIYKTRVKQYSSMPYFEAGTERFVRDWRNAVVRVQVRDARVREKDPVLGIVTVRLAELFEKSSEVTRLFSLQEGIGYGRANISFMFRQIKTDLPRSLFGWETGTLEVPSGVRIEPAPGFEGFTAKKLEISTTNNTYKVPSSAAQRENGAVYWDIPIEKVRLPVYNRYSSAVVFDIGSGGLGVGGEDFVAVYWFQDMPDDEEIQVRVPVIKSKDLKQIKQNYINEQTAKTHQYEIVGWLTCTLVLDSGLDPDHEDFQKTRDEKHRYEAYDRVEGQAQLAQRTQASREDGDVSKKDQKEIDEERKRQLEMRHRGVMQYKAARTSKWTKEGLKKRAGALKDKITGNGGSDKSRNPVESEA